MSHVIWMRHVIHTNESLHTHSCVTTHTMTHTHTHTHINAQRAWRQASKEARIAHIAPIPWLHANITRSFGDTNTHAHTHTIFVAVLYNLL